MSISQNQRRRGRSRGPGVPAGREPELSGSDADGLAGLRRAVAGLDPRAFADCFADDGWVRVPRPEGDVVLRGPEDIEFAGQQLRDQLAELTWTPSQRFVAAGQVVEEAVVRARTVTRPPSDEVRVSMRAVVELDPAGRIGSLTLWVDWAALWDPQGVDSAHGAASALVAQARARDARGLRVIKSEPGAAPAAVPEAVELPVLPASTRPPGLVLWWRQHRATFAGSVMALAAAGVIGWVATSVLKPIVDHRLGSGTSSVAVTDAATPGSGTATGDAGGAGGTAPDNTGNRPGTGASAAGAATGAPSESRGPKITKRERAAVQPGKQYAIKTDFLFETGSAELNNKAQARLMGFSQKIRDQNVVGTIQINGYTDNVGTEADNKLLSQDRAYKVAQVLRSQLADETDIEFQIQGFGELRPQAPNSTAEGRRQNRKVIIVLPKPKQSAPSATP